MAQVLYLKDKQDRNMELEAEDYLFILKEFHRLLRRDLEPSVYSVFCAIEDHAGPGEQEDNPANSCTAATTTLGKETKTGRTTVYRAIVTLEEMGLVTVEERDGRPSIIRPIVTSEARAAFLLNGKGVNPTCVKLIQATYPNQNETGTPQRDMTRFKMKQPPVSKWNTKETKIKQENKELNTDVFNGENSPLSDETNRNQSKTEIPKQENTSTPEPEQAKDPPLDKQGTMLNRFKSAYLAVGSDPANHNKRCGVIGDAWEEIIGKKRDYKFISKVMRDDAKGVGWKLIEALLSMANKDITEDPEGYLRRILQNGSQQQRGPYLAGNSRNQQLEERPAYARAFKPTGSGPGGLNTEEDLRQSYNS